MLKIGQIIYLKTTPFGDFFLPSGKKEVTDVRSFSGEIWVMIKDYNDWINSKWFIWD